MLKFYLRQLFVVIIALLCSVAASAQDFEVDGIYYNITSETELTVEVTYRGKNHAAFSNEYSGSVVIPSAVNYNGTIYSVTCIGENAFCRCTGVSNVIIPKSVTRIKDNAFNGCHNLISVTLPNNLLTIGWSAFAYCYELININIPESLTFVDEYALLSTRWYSRQPDGIVYLGEVLYKYKGNMPQDANIEVKEGVTHITAGAFRDCKGLTSIVIPNSVTNIGEMAFEECSSLTNVSIGNNVKYIGYNAFCGCRSLTNITIPNSVTWIGKQAFYGCSGLTSVTIGSSVTSIEDYAFYGSTSGLTKIYLLNEIPADINSYTFSNYNATLYVPQGSLAAYKAANYWKNFKNIVEFDPTGIEDVADEEDAPVIKVAAGGIQLTAAEGKAVAVYSTNGALVEKIDSYAGEEITLDKGVYIIRVGSKAVKVKL
ncbi:MAG: leucine-rich repeat domain-containing protein [Bacteroidaceae bacterium]|nr:leucine-rich repeat domain-containing protein [Bacteroidaceae bacterium]